MRSVVEGSGGGEMETTVLEQQLKNVKKNRQGDIKNSIGNGR